MVSSHFSRFLGTNYAPTTIEALQIRELLTSATPKLSQLDREVEQASQVLKVAEGKRNAHFSFMEAHRALLSHARSLPLDILHCIFLLCLPVDHNAVMSSKECPILLTHICQRWRDAALNMPLLWSSIHIPIPQHPSTASVPCFAGLSRGIQPTGVLTEEQTALWNAELQYWEIRMTERKQLASLWLERAKGSSLSVSIYQHPLGIDHNISQPINDAIAVVLAYSGQLESLEVSAYHSLVASHIGIPSSETPRLRHITVSFTKPLKFTQLSQWSAIPQQPNANDSDPPSIFAPGNVISSPNLRTLAMVSIPEEILGIPVQWGNLTELFVHWIGSKNANASQCLLDSPTARQILQRCPRLKGCRLVIDDAYLGVEVEHPAMQDTAPVILADLERLAIYEVANDRPMVDFIRSLELPSLNTLTFLTSVSPLNRHHPSSLLTILRNWGCNVHTLTFDYRNLTNAQLRECLVLAPSTTHLKLNVDEPLVSRLPRYANHILGSEVMGDYILSPYADKIAVFSDQLLAGMTPQNGKEPTLCPRLAVFSVKLHTAEVAEESVIEFIRAKRIFPSVDGGAATLKKATVHFAVRWPKRFDKVKKSSIIRDRGGIPLSCPFFAQLQEDPELDLKWLELDIRWPQVESYSEEVWKPKYGLGL